MNQHFRQLRFIGTYCDRILRKVNASDIYDTKEFTYFFGLIKKIKSRFSHSILGCREKIGHSYKN